MSDLISREAILKLLRDERDRAIATSNTYGDKNVLDCDEDEVYADNLDSWIAQVEALSSITPQVVANISGGILQGASADYPVDVYTLDFDIDGEEPSELALVDDSEARIGQVGALVDPEWVNKVTNLPTLDEAVACANCDWEGRIDDCNELKDVLERVGPGEIMPAGECPECGAVAHLIREPDDD